MCACVGELTTVLRIFVVIAFGSEFFSRLLRCLSTNDFFPHCHHHRSKLHSRWTITIELKLPAFRFSISGSGNVGAGIINSRIFLVVNRLATVYLCLCECACKWLCGVVTCEQLMLKRFGYLGNKSHFNNFWMNSIQMVYKWYSSITGFGKVDFFIFFQFTCSLIS